MRWFGVQLESLGISAKEVNSSLRGKIEGRGRDFSSWIILGILDCLTYKKEWSYTFRNWIVFWLLWKREGGWSNFRLDCCSSGAYKFLVWKLN